MYPTDEDEIDASTTVSQVSNEEDRSEDEEPSILNWSAYQRELKDRYNIIRAGLIILFLIAFFLMGYSRIHDERRVCRGDQETLDGLFKQPVEHSQLNRTAAATAKN